jgi:hypothetical protein
MKALPYPQGFFVCYWNIPKSYDSDFNIPGQNMPNQDGISKKKTHLNLASRVRICQKRNAIGWIKKKYETP